MLLSIVVPFYNISNELFFPFLKSLKEQDNQNYELLIIDDGSTKQESIAALNSINSSNIRIFHKTNGGLSSARNYGIDRINGDLLWIIDPDDYIPDKSTVTKIINTFESNHDLSLLTFGYSEKLSNGKRIDKRKSKRCKSFSGTEGFKYLAIGNGIMSGYTWNKVFNIARIGRENLGIFDSDLLLYEDKFWLFKLLLKIDRCLYIPDILYQYNYNQTSLSHTISEAKAYSAYIDHILPYIALIKGRNSIEYQSAVAFIYRRGWYESFNWIGKSNKSDRLAHYDWLLILHKLVSECKFRNMPKDIIFLWYIEPIIRLMLRM